MSYTIGQVLFVVATVGLTASVAAGLLFGLGTLLWRQVRQDKLEPSRSAP